MDWLNDQDLLPTERRLLRAFGTPRRGLDGQLVWPVDELPPHLRRAGVRPMPRPQAVAVTGVPG
jgi:hypothetical protein